MVKKDWANIFFDLLILTTLDNELWAFFFLENSSNLAFTIDIAFLINDVIDDGSILCEEKDSEAMELLFG